MLESTARISGVLGVRHVIHGQSLCGSRNDGLILSEDGIGSASKDSKSGKEASHLVFFYFTIII